MLSENPLHGLRDRLLVLHSSPNFSSLEDEDLTHMAEHARERRFQKGELLFDDCPVDRLHIVLSGRVTVSRNGAPITVVDGHGGVGALALFARDSECWRASADQDTLVLEVPEGPFRSALKESFPLFRNSLRLVAMSLLRRRGNLPASRESTATPALGRRPDRDRTLVERMIELRSQGGPFAGGNMDALIELARRTTQFQVPAGHTFWQVGDASTHSLRIIYGHVRCETGNDARVTVGAEFVLGALDGLSMQARSYAAVAETDIVAYRTDVDELLEVLELQPDLALALLGELARALILLGGGG